MQQREIRNPSGLKAFGKHLRDRRRELGLSQEELAWKADSELSQISYMVTFRLLYPLPCGVVMGALSKTLVRCKEFQASVGIPEVLPLR